MRLFLLVAMVTTGRATDLANEQASCNMKTDGTCHIYDCHAGRGPTFCSQGRCICQAGYCSPQDLKSRIVNGSKCLPDPRIPIGCKVDTGLVCKGEIFGKSPPKRAGPSICVITKPPSVILPEFTAVCQEGFCVQDTTQGPTCVRNKEWKCMRSTPGTCNVLRCHASRGPTDCFAGICVCKEGYCANKHGKCVASEDTKDLAARSFEYPDYSYQLTRYVSFYGGTLIVWFGVSAAGIAMVVSRLKSRRLATGSAVEPLLHG